MTRLLLVVVAAMVVAGAEKKAPVAAPAKSEVPAGATQVDGNTYRFTDPKGKNWVYRKTPFGWAKAEEKPGETAASPAPKVETKMVEDGDTIRFEKPGPFGVYKWQRKKSELTADERAAWEQAREKAAAKDK
ncbi:MAG: hypothetical protein HYR60_07470 [Acidobacteria bacterium]|nr:hypothetical protein [Acidobacteriota bacterium]MBI3470131.1 hypothetical protein [Candidatus Solibacter usitatus]